ncbi:protein phosphatase regulator [Penicillium canescens]|nr:protein phosphatase regulator [Penicillium canescens]
MATIALPGSPESFGPTGRTSRGCRALFTTHNEDWVSCVPSPTRLTAKSPTLPERPRRKSAIRTRPADAKQAVEEPTANAKKTVHFNGSSEEIRFFSAADAPVTSTSKLYSPAQGADANGPIYNVPFQLGHQNTFCPLNYAIDAPSPSQPIQLRSLALSPSLHELHGTVAVANPAYEKEVSARFTLDNWKTASNVGAEHLQSLYLGQSIISDLFSFVIDRKSVPLSAGNILHICVRYKVLDHVFWDNNGGMNYQVNWTV